MKQQPEQLPRRRFTYMVILGIVISVLLRLVVPTPPGEVYFLKDMLTSIVITIIIWEGNNRLSIWMNRIYPWEARPGLRISVQVLISLLYTAGAIYLSLQLYNQFLCNIPQQKSESIRNLSVIIGLLVTLIIIASQSGFHFFRQWKESLLEMEKHKKDAVHAQLSALRSQVNPHFLFNNLSVLSSLVYKDQDKAVQFIDQLSKVYRYVLDIHQEELVTLAAEHEFITAYIYLLNIRFGENIHFSIDLNAEDKNKYLPPLSLQLLIENTIKHNIVSSEKPLRVSIRSQHDTICIVNNIQRRLHPESGLGTGINNLRSRYQHYTTHPVVVTENQELFSVCLPLLPPDTRT